MIQTCPKCHKEYDDARRNTFCPHAAFITEAEAKRKDYAMSLIDKVIRFRSGYGPHGPQRIQSIQSSGFITLAGHPAHHLYEPTLFEEITP